MAKNFTDTQTGGSGATSQIGEKAIEAKTIERSPGRPANLVDTDNGGDKRKRKMGASTSEAVNPTPPVVPDNTQSYTPDVQEEAVQQELAPIIQGEQVELEFPMVAKIDALEKQEEVFQKSSFGIPDNEIVSDPEPDKYSSSFGIPDNEILGEGNSSPFNTEDEPKKDGEILSYPNRTTQYIIKDDKWLERSDSNSEWTPIKERGRVLALNDYHKRKIPLPENTYKPKKGGVEMEGTQVYGYPSRPGTAYTIQNGSWYTMKQGDNSWSIINEGDRIKSLNRYHGVSVETPEQLERKGASMKPGTLRAFEDSKDGKSVGSSDVLGDIKLNIHRDQQKRILTALGDQSTQAGDVLEARGLGFNKTDVDLATDSRGAAIQQYGTHVDALFNTPDRPTDLIGGRMWDEKYGRMLPPTDQDIINAKDSKQILLDDLELQLNAQSSDAQRAEIIKIFNPLLSEADVAIKNAEQGKLSASESFNNRHEYMQSDQYKEGKRNNLYVQKALLQDKTYGMYSPEGAEQMVLDDAKIIDLNKEIASEKLDNFVNTDLKKWNAISGLSDSQLAQLELAQERAKNSLSLGAFSNGEEQVAEVDQFMEVSTQINNRLADAYNRGMDITDVLVENKKVLYSQSKDMVSKEVGAVFESTLAIRDFMSPYIDSGKVKVDALSGRYDIAEGVNGAERAYIETKLSELLDSYDVAKSAIYTENRGVMADKKKEMNSLQAAIAKAELDMESGDVVSNEAAKKQLNEAKDRIRELKTDIRELEGSENTMFLNDPKKLALETSVTATTSSRQILQAIPEGVTPKQRLDIFYETLLKKNQALAKQHNISQDYFDRTGEKIRDILDWEFMGAKLSPQEIEYYKNAATLRQMLPLYLNNDWGVTEESAGFWSAFDNALTSTFAPNTSGAYGFYNETSMVATHLSMAQQAGLTEEDMADGMDYDKMLNRMDVDFLTFETAGTMIGTTSAIMLAMVGSGLSTTGAAKTGKGIYKLMNRYEKLDNITDAVKDFQRVEQAYQNTMKSTKFGRFINQTATEGLKFEYTGMLFNMDEEMNFMSGMGGAIAGKGFEAVFKKMTPSKVVEWVGGFFGGNTDKAVNVLKKYGEQTRSLRAAHYRGLGEMPEEFAQELIGIYRDELKTRGFWDEVKSQYGDLSNLGELLLSSYVLGAGMGTVMTSTQQDIIDTLPPGELEVVRNAQRAIHKDMSTANANADVAADRIVNNYEAVIDEAVNPARSKKPEESTLKEDVNADGVDKQIPFGELVYDNGKVGIWKKIPGSGTPFFEEKRGMTESDIQKAIESGTIRDMSATTSKPASLESNGDSDVDVEQQSTEKPLDINSESTAETSVDGEVDNDTKVVSLADRIRSGKIDMTGIAASMPPGLVPVVNAAIEAAAVTVETIESVVKGIKSSVEYKKLNKEDKLKADEALNKLEADVNDTGISHKVPKSPTKPLQQVKNKIATFKQGRKAGAKDNRKLTKEEFAKKKSDIEDIQEEIITYARENLPKGSYNSQDVTNLMAKVRRATTMGGVDKAIEAVDRQVAKFEEKARANTADRIMATFADPLTKKRGDKKVSKIDRQSRENLQALADEIGVENVGSMSQEQLDEVEAKVDAIISEGKGVITEKEQAKKTEKREEREVPFRLLSAQNQRITGTKAGEKQIGDFFKSKQGAIVYDGELFTSKQDFDDYLKDNNSSYDEVGEVQTTLSSDEKTAQKAYEGKSKAKRATRKVSDFVQESARTLESRLMDVYRGSKELRTWTEDKILKPVNKAYVDRNDARKAKLDSFKKGMNEVFGHSVVTGLPKSLNEDSGIKIYEEGIEVNNNQAVNIYTMSTVDPSMIYKVGDEYYGSQNAAEASAKNSGKEVEEVTDKYNVNVLSQISEGQNIESGLEKISEIEKYIEEDAKMKAFSDLIKSKYKEYRADYEGTFTEMYDLNFKDGDYVPMTRSIAPEMDVNSSVLLGNNFKGGASTAMSKHLKQKYNNSNAKYDFTTGAYEKLLEYVNSMEHAKHFLPVAESSKNLINKTTKPQLIEKLGKSRVSELEYHLNDIITDGVSANRSTGGKAINTLLKYNVVTTLAFKLGSIPKQLTSATHYLGAGLEDGVGTLKVAAQSLKLFPALTGTAKFVLNKNESDVINAIFNSSFIQERYSGKDIDFETRKMFNEMSNSKGKNLQNNLVKMAMSPTVIGDIGGVLMGGIPLTLALYNNNVSNKGMNHQEAMDNAVNRFIEISNKTQQSVRRDILSNAQTDPTYRMFLTYKTSQIAAMSQMVKGMKILTDKEGGYTAKEKTRAVRQIAYYSVSNAMFQLVAGGTLGMILSDDDDDKERAEERKKTAIYNLVMDTLSSNAQGFGLGGMLADWTMNWLRNREIFNNIPVVQMAEDLVNGAGSLIRVVGDGGTPWMDMSDKDIATWEKIGGIKNILQTVNSWNQFSEGDIDGWDAIMNRTVDEESGHQYVTGGEREDWIYNKLFGKEYTEGIEPFRDGTESRMNESDLIEGITEEAPEDNSEKLLERFGAGVSNEEYTYDDSPIERKERNAEEIKMRKESEESIEQEKKKTQALIDDQKNSSKSKNKTLTNDELRDQKRSEWAVEYKKKFGTSPSSDMSLDDIMEAIIFGKK